MIMVTQMDYTYMPYMAAVYDNLEHIKKLKR